MYPTCPRAASLLFAGSLALLATACGGGGGGGGVVVVNLGSAPMANSLQTYYTTSHSQTLSAKDSSGNTYTIQDTQNPGGGTATFRGTPASSATSTTVITKNGVLASTVTSVKYFTTSPFVPVGSTELTNGTWTLVPGYTPLPATVSVGQSGNLLTATDYQDSTLGVVTATETTTWNASTNNASTLMFCASTVITAVPGNAIGQTSGSENDCYTVDANGTMTFNNATVTTSTGVTLTFK